MRRHWALIATIATTMLVAGCGSRSGDGAAPEHAEPLHHHAISTVDELQVSAVRDSDGQLTGLAIGETEVSLSERISRVSGLAPRRAVGPVVHGDGIIVRHVDTQWNERTGGEPEAFDHISYGAWSTGTFTGGGNAALVYDYGSIGGAYLVALDDARTQDMPDIGTATYLGSYTGFYKFPGEGGARGHMTFDVEMTADFANAEMRVSLFGVGGILRVAVDGDIQGNAFSGSDIHHLDVSRSNLLQAEGATAEFEGGFYGEGAAEAGGVFEVVGGGDDHPGRIVGAFGGKVAGP